MQPMINPKYPGLSVRVADDGFAAYVWGSDFSFEVSAYAQAQSEQVVAKWPLHHHSVPQVLRHRPRRIQQLSRCSRQCGVHGLPG